MRHTGSGFDVTFPAKVGMLFGGFSSAFGWIFFTIGMLFMLVFGALADLSSLRFMGDTVEVQAELTRIEGTNARINEEPVFAYHYRFFTPLEEEYAGVSYQTGEGLDVGQRVSVEFVLANPGLSRIQGMQSNVFPLWILLPLAIFPLLGLVFIVIGIRRGVRAIRILRNGAMTRGRLVDKQRTSTRVNNQRVYRLVFEYEDGLGRKYTTDAKTHETHRLQDEAEERLVYDRHAPGRAILVDNLPGAPRLDVDRGVYEASVPKAVALLVLPVLGTGMAVAFVFMAWVAIT